MRTLFILALTVASLIYSGCKKTPMNYTSKMGSVHSWSGTTVSQFTMLNPVVTTNYTDTSFALGILSGNTVDFWGAILTYSKTDLGAKCYIFSYNSGNDPSNGMTQSSALYYYYEADSMTFSSSSSHHDISADMSFHTN